MCATAECACYEYDPRDWVSVDRADMLVDLAAQIGQRPSVASVLRQLRTRRAALAVKCWMCANRRKYAQESGHTFSWLNYCYPCWLKRHERKELARRASCAFVVAAGALLGLGYVAKVAWELRGLVGR